MATISRAAFLAACLTCGAAAGQTPDKPPESEPADPDNIPTAAKLFRGTEISRLATEDRASNFPNEGDHPYIYYLVADQTTAQLLSWVLSSTSRQPLIDLCQPQLVAEDLWRIDIRALLWEQSDWQKVLESHPYGGYVMLIRGDWLATELLDTQFSAARSADGIAAYYRLLYGTEHIPATEAEFLAFWEVDSTDRRRRGLVEGRSRVNNRGRRWIETRNRPDGYAFLTRDSEILDTERDPLERPDGSFRFDGAELIVGVLKTSGKNYDRGAVQYYFLANGEGQRVDEAPVQLVIDHTNARNLPSIRTWISCLKCHVEGIRPLGVNALVELSRKHGTAIFTADPLEMQRFHFGGLDQDVSRAQEDYLRGVKLHTEWTPEQLVEALENVVRGYDADLDLARAASELGVTAEALQQKIRAANVVPSGIAMLASGGKCSRDLFAQQFEFLDGILKQ